MLTDAVKKVRDDRPAPAETGRRLARDVARQPAGRGGTTRVDLERRLRARMRVLNETVIAHLEDRPERYRAHDLRRTEIANFDAVAVRAVAAADIELAYDPRTGSLASEVKGGRHQRALSEYDRIRAVCQDDVFRFIGPEAKEPAPPSRPPGSPVAGGDADEDGQYSLFGHAGEGN